MTTIMKAAFGTGTYTLGENGKLEKDQEYPIQVGQILFLNGYGQTVHNHERLAVYKIEHTDFGPKYHCVNLDKPSLCIKDRVKPVEKLFGIGIYFKQGDMATQEEIDEVLPMAQAAEKMKNGKRDAERRESEAQAEIARKWWADNTPKWAKAYIVAELKKDESDSMSDYFHASTSRVLLLAWSASDRLNFKEMREAGKQIPKEIENLDELKEDRYHRILGNYYHGWTIKKYRIGGFNGYSEQVCVADPDNVRLKSTHHYKDEPTAQQPTGGKIALCKLNSAKGGIELYFNSKPSQAVLDDLKSKSWRWSKFNKCWYRLDNPIARQQAAKYADIPTESTQDGLLVEAQENAAQDNWAQANGI